MQARVCKLDQCACKTVCVRPVDCVALMIIIEIVSLMRCLTQTSPVSNLTRTRLEPDLNFDDGHSS